MPANPVWTTLVPVVGERELRFVHEIVVGLIKIRGRAVRITKRQVNVRRIGRRRAGRDSKRRHVVGDEIIVVWTNVVRVLIVNLIFEDREGALFARLEVHVRSDNPDLICTGNGGVVMKPRTGAVDIEPGAIYVDRFSKVNCDTPIAWRVDAVLARIAAKYGWTNLHDRCSAAWVWSGRDEVGLIVVVIHRAAVIS